jgi:putative ABC transport system permease protein
MFTDILYRLRAAFRRSTVERELDRELRFHVQQQTDKYMSAGLSREEAARRVRLEFGGLDQLKEECRDARGIGVLEEIARNLRYACRTLAKRPGFTVVATTTLALGIGANSAVFSALNAILLRPLPYPDADRVMLLEQYEPKAATLGTFVAPPRLADWQRLSRTFEAISGYFADDISETAGELPERIGCAWVAPAFFQVWHVVPAIGRAFTPEEERFGGPRAVVVSDRFWKRRFGADATMAGRVVRIGQQSYPIVGVMPASFLFPIRDIDVWSPSPLDAPYARSRQSTWFTVVGRLKAGVTRAEAAADFDQLQANLGRQYPATDAQLAVRVRPLKDMIVGDVGRSLWLLFGAVSLLLLIACTNIAALLLARTADRQQEITIRYSLGASRGSIVRQLLTEALLLALLGSLLGLLVARTAIATFHEMATNLPRISEVRLDPALLAYSLVCAAAATLVFGLVPAMRNTSRAGGARTYTPATHRLQWALVGIQVALAVTLLIGSGLLLRSFDALRRVSPGFEPNGVLTFRITGNWGETVDLNALRRRMDLTLDGLRAVPGVEGAATSLAAPGVPFEHATELRFVEGESTPGSKMFAHTRVVSAGYFATMRIGVLAGEDCGRDAAVPSALVNRQFASLYLPGRTLVGRHVEQVPANPFIGAARIIGMVADAREQGLNLEPVPIVYWCNSAPVPAPLFLLRTRNEPMSMAETIRRKVHELEPHRSVYELMPLELRLADTVAEDRLRTTLLTFFAGTAIALAAVGLYGTLSYFVVMRRREIGVRLAMGALRWEIVSAFLRQGLRVSIAGCLAGLWLAAALGRALSGMLYGVSALDAPTFGGVILLVVLTSVAASLWPAFRASRIEPMRVLREE